MTSTGRRGGAAVWAGATVVGGKAWVVVVVGEAATITEIPRWDSPGPGPWVTGFSDVGGSDGLAGGAAPAAPSASAPLAVATVPTTMAMSQRRSTIRLARTLVWLPATGTNIAQVLVSDADLCSS